MKKIAKVSIVAGLLMTLFTGCPLVDNEDSVESSPSSSGGTDKLSLSKTGEGFLVSWTKKGSGYGEVIYNDGQYARKLITTNSTGTFFANCVKQSSETYRCKRSNLSGEYANRTVSFILGKQYQWYTTSGFDHIKGSVEAVTESNNGILTIN